MRFPVTVNGCVYPHGDKDVETRVELLERLTGGSTLEQKDVEFVTKFIEALAETIGSRRKSVFPGLGTFEWKPYRHRTPDGKILKSSSLYIRNSRGAVTAIFSINYDITNIMMMHQELGEFMLTRDREQSEPEKIINVNNVLSELIEQSVSLVGKPVALMSKDDKVRAIRFLSDAGAFLVTKSGDKVAKYFGISKYTLYSYIDANKQQEEKKHG